MTDAKNAKKVNVKNAKPKTRKRRKSKRQRREKKSTKNAKPKTRKTSRAPQTMEELVKKTGYQFPGLRKGSQVEGTITDISKQAVLIDIGAKTEGLVISKERELIEDYVAQLKVGDKIKVVVFSPENDKGQILLSLREAAADHKWNLFNQYLETKEIVKVRGLDINKGGLVARFMGVRGFVPASQLGRKYLGKPEELQNKLFKVKVIEVDREKNRLIFSEKQVSEADALAAKKEALKRIKVGGAYQGRVSGVMPFGIFVHVEEKESAKKKGAGLFLEGLVHISEISWERVDDLNKMFKVGDRVEVKVLEVNEEDGKLNLSIKQLTDDPWTQIAKKYPVDKKVKGKVTRLVAFGAFVELEPGIEGLIHISKIPAEYKIKKGDQVNVYVESVDLEKRRMSLGLVLKAKPVGYK